MSLLLLIVMKEKCNMIEQLNWKRDMGKAHEVNFDTDICIHWHTLESHKNTKLETIIFMQRTCKAKIDR